MTAPGQADIPAGEALAALAAARWLLMPGNKARPMSTDLASQPLLASAVVVDDDGHVTAVDPTGLMALIGASLPAVVADLKAHQDALGPLERVAASLPTIVSNSDHVHDELKQGQQAVRDAVTAIQQASANLGNSLTGITQLAAQAQAQAAIANVSASAAGQRCAALESQYATLAAKVANHETRIAALEARKAQTWRAAGNLPTLALNGTVDVTCTWTSAVPSPLPSLDQCQAFIAGSAVPTVKSVATSGIVVTLKAASSLLPAPAAVQVIATTW